MKNIADQVSRSSKKLLFKEPFYGLFLVGLNKEYSERVPTAGVSKNDIGVKLAINPKFFMDLNEDHRMGLIKHEAFAYIFWSPNCT